MVVNTILKRIFEKKKMCSETANRIRELLDTTNECLNNLQNNNVNMENWDILIICIIVNNFDENTHKLWEEELIGIPVDELPTLEWLKRFLEGRFRVLEMVKSKNKREETTKLKTNSFLTTTNNNKKDLKCIFCKKKGHFIAFCEEFLMSCPIEHAAEI